MKYAAIGAIAVLAVIAYHFYKKSKAVPAPRRFKQLDGMVVDQIPKDLLTGEIGAMPGGGLGSILQGG